VCPLHAFIVPGREAELGEVPLHFVKVAEEYGAAAGGKEQHLVVYVG